MAVLHLSAFLKETLFLLHVDLFVRHVVPVNLELGDSGLFRENVSGEAADFGSWWRVLVQFWSIVFNVNVVTNS